MKHFIRTAITSCILFIYQSGNIVFGQIIWPSDQLLPSFPDAAQTQDLITLNSEAGTTTEELYLFASLKGIVNKTKPRIFSYEGDAFAEGTYTWLNSLGLKWNLYTDPWKLIDKYLGEISGLIIYDPNQIHTVNLATTLAGDLNALIVSPQLAEKLSSSPYNLPVLKDLQGQFSSKLDVYRALYNDYWPDLDKRMIIGLNPEVHKASLREYAVALGAAVIWLDPQTSSENFVLNQFLETVSANGIYMGWWKDEQVGITKASRYGIATVASDWSTNLTVHSGTSRIIDVKPIPPTPTLQNKIYVGFILSDGDNLQYVEHLMRKLWNNKDRGAVPIGWTVSPAMVDAMPGALNYYWKTATDNDNLLSGPSGYGYIYPNFWPEGELDDFAQVTQRYMDKAGLHVLTIWNTIDGDEGISTASGNAFGDNSTTLLGITDQRTSGRLTMFNNELPSLDLACNYCWDEPTMYNSILNASVNWDGSEPLFLLIQSQPWQGTTPTTFKNVANSLDASKYEVVRPDHLFQLLRAKQSIVTSIDEPDSSLSLKIYPNPTASVIAMRFEKNAYHSLKVFDMNGRELMAADIPSNSDFYELNVESLTKGTYIVSFYGKQGVVSRKIVK